MYLENTIYISSKAHSVKASSQQSLTDLEGQVL